MSTHVEPPMTAAAQTRWQSIQRNTSAPTTLYEVKADGGFVFGIRLGGHWSTYAVNPDGGKAYWLGA